MKVKKISLMAMFVMLLLALVNTATAICGSMEITGEPKIYEAGVKDYEISIVDVTGDDVTLNINGEAIFFSKSTEQKLMDGTEATIDLKGNVLEFCFEGDLFPKLPQTHKPSVKLDLANYEKMFVIGREFNGYVVVGSEGIPTYVIAATDISTSFMELVDRVGAVRLNREMESLNNNIISIGGPCDNHMTKRISGIEDCDFGLRSNEGLIKLYNHNGWAHIVVAGGSESSMKEAAKVLSHWKDYQLSGDEYRVEKIVPPEPPTEPEPTCYDGIKNDGEEGVDCGGPCKPCPVVEQPCSGCKRNGDCLPFGTRLVEDGVPKYCSITKEFELQKGADEACQNNYECSTNICVDSKCISSGLITRILNWFKSFFG